MVAQGAAVDGSDLAVVSVREGVTVSLPRTLDRGSRWNHEYTTIWFTTDAEIPQGSTVDDRYHLVTQESGVVPNTDEFKIFLDAEDFGSSALNPTKWSEVVSVGGIRSLTQTSDAVLLKAQPHNFDPISYITLRQAPRSYWSSIRIDAKTRFTNTGLNGSCGLLFPVSLTSADNSLLRAGLRSNISQYAGLSHNDPLGVDDVTPILEPLPRNGIWEVHSLSWTQNDIAYWRDGVRLLETRSQGSITRPNQTHLQLEFAAGASNSGCDGSGELGLEVDWYRVRRYTFPEPTARLK